MAVVACVHAADEAKVVGNLRSVRQQLAEIHAALAMFFELPRATEKFAAGLIGEAILDAAAVIHAVAALQLRLGVSKVHVARAAVHEQGNHRFGAWREVRLLGLQVKPPLRARNVLGCAEQFFPLQQPC